MANFFIGLDDSREWASGFYDVPLRRPVSRHAADWYLDVLRCSGRARAPKFHLASSSPRRARRSRRNGRPAPIAGSRLQPGARWMNKRWPAEHFAGLVREFSRANIADFRFVILGSQSLMRSLGRTVSSRRIPKACLDLTGKTSLTGNDRMDSRVRTHRDERHRTDARGDGLGQTAWSLCSVPLNPLHTGPYRRPHEILQLDLPCVPCRSERCTNIRDWNACARFSENVMEAMEARLREVAIRKRYR